MAVCASDTILQLTSNLDRVFLVAKLLLFGVEASTAICDVNLVGRKEGEYLRVLRQSP